MGWVVSIALLFVGLVNNDSGMIFASGLFAISGSISAWSSKLADLIKEVTKETKQET